MYAIVFNQQLPNMFKPNIQRKNALQMDIDYFERLKQPWGIDIICPH